jgi:uncharacterized protein YcbK (DUF882 family)
MANFGRNQDLDGTACCGRNVAAGKKMLGDCGDCRSNQGFTNVGRRKTMTSGTSEIRTNATGTSPILSRRGLLGIFAATAVTAAPHYANAFGFLRGGGDVRRLKVYSGRTGERLDMIYWIDGQYVPEALAEINHFFRDWRNNRVHRIDTRTLDILAATSTLLDTTEPYMLLSGYRSPETNAMLRQRSRGVASNSRHTIGQAADLRMNSRTVRQIAQAAAACNAGGVGRYSRSNFTHVDCGPVHSWGA